MVLRFLKKMSISFIVLLIIDAIVAWFSGPFTLVKYGYVVIYSGIIVFVISLFAIGGDFAYGGIRGVPGASSAARPHIISDSAFLKIFNNERPYRETIFSITATSVLLIPLGYLITVIFWQ